MSSNLSASDFNNWIIKINSARAKTGIGLSALTSSVSSGEIASSNKMTQLQTDILGMKNQYFLSYMNFNNITGLSFSAGTIITENQKAKIESTVLDLTRLTCGKNSTQNYSVCSDYTTNTANSTDSTNNTCTNTGQNESCSRTTNSTNSTTQCYYGPAYGGTSNSKSYNSTRNSPGTPFSYHNGISGGKYNTYTFSENSNNSFESSSFSEFTSNTTDFGGNRTNSVNSNTSYSTKGVSNSTNSRSYSYKTCGDFSAGSDRTCQVSNSTNSTNKTYGVLS